MLEGMHRYHAIVVISCQQNERGQYTVRDVMQRRYGVDEVEVMGVIRVSVVARPGIPNCKFVKLKHIQDTDLGYCSTKGSHRRTVDAGSDKKTSV